MHNMQLVFDENFDRNEGVWRDYAPGVRAKIRPALSKAEFRKLRKKAEKSNKGFRKSQGVDEDYFDALFYQKLVEDWEGVVDTKGNPIPCNDEMIAKVCDAFTGFAVWIVEESEDIAEQHNQEKEEEIKNSQSSQDGSQTGPKESAAAAPAE